ncbi:hypothetical protein ruthe_00155 [Rubellimicrobium thermophilum DSM 16684]|uniref:Tat pathway signal sequence domain protein n=2 Tax=Rubellimicrobium TaxID=295418 RepID=S9R6Y6_9RHOB|nr:hypothetical protein ruthe_00155 [Rubellimicrobium thermophilum DSM 16684]
MVRRAACFAALAMMAGLPAAGEEPAAGRLRLELNRLDQQDGACRLTFVAENGISAIAGLTLETVIFDRAGQVAALNLFDLGELPAGRMRVRQFDVPEVECGTIGQVLVNGVAACAGEGLTVPDCTAALEVTTTVEGVEVMQ